MQAPQNLPPLVPTKLSAPQPLHEWVLRERLFALLDATPCAGLTLVVAPAGFGKTTLVAQWVQRQMSYERAVGVRGHSSSPAHAPAAWLTLDAYDQEGLRFLVYLAGAIEHARPGTLVTTLPLLNAVGPAPLYMLLQAILVDLSTVTGTLTLVLDDYHAVTSTPVHQLVAYLVRRLPPQCRLVVISRVDPPLPLAQLRAAGRLAILRSADLRFTETEARLLIRRLTHRALDEAAIAALLEQTEGWALALRLAITEQAGEPGKSQLPATTRFAIGEYLANEVLANQPEPLQRSLMALAIPDRFCAELWAALDDPTDTPGGMERRIEELLRANLLIVALDEAWHWFRFHPLFRDLLLRRLRQTTDAPTLRALQLRAARWFGEAMLLEEAIQLYLAAGDEDTAARLIEQAMAPALGRNLSTGPTETWLRLLPPAVIARRPGLALIEARLANAQINIPLMARSLARVDTLLAAQPPAAFEPPWPTFNGDRMALQGMLESWRGRHAEALSTLLLALKQPIAPVLAASAVNHIGMALVAEGRYAEEVTLARACITPPTTKAEAAATASQYVGLCQMHLQAGDFLALAEDAGRLAELVAAQQPGEVWRCYADAFLGRVAYERLDMATAEDVLRAVIDRRYQVNTLLFINCLIGLARIGALAGDGASTARYEQDVQRFARETGGVALMDHARGCATWLALRAGNVSTALRLSQEIGPDRLMLSYGFESPQLARAAALVASGGRGNLMEAEVVIARCIAESERLHLTRHLTIALAMQALLRQAQGRSFEALTPLERAVTLAAPRGMGRTLLDLGPALRPLLHALAERGIARAYVEALLRHDEREPDAWPLPSHNLASEHLPELLTRRETEVLALLAERWSNQEIAERLGITTNTTRKHTSTIYEKLGVNSRREAVTVARALGLLPAG